MKFRNSHVASISVVFLFSTLTLFAQNEQNNFFNPHVKGDSIILGIADHRGDISWQQSIDLKQWVDLLNENNDTIVLIADSSVYLRAKIVEGTCEPIYSDTLWFDIYDTTSAGFIEDAYPDQTGEIISLSFDSLNITVEKIEEDYIFQGDMILTKDQINYSNSKGASFSEFIKRWNNNTVYYSIDKDLPLQDRVSEAIEQWELETPIRFIERTNEDNYVEFVPNIINQDVCKSNEGMTGGRQKIWLGNNCTYGNTMHEIGHTVGLIHEHSRSDREKFITIHEENIILLKRHNFEIIDNSLNTEDFDYKSIMMYHHKAFSKNDEETITKNDGTKYFIQRYYLTQNDIDAVFNFYEIPNPDFEVESRTVIVNSEIHFTDLSTNNPTAWYWEFGDGGKSTEKNPTYSYEEAGIYTVSLNAKNENGEYTEIKSDYITVIESENGILFNPDLTYGSLSDVDGNVYKTIQIGDQEWMAENLKTTRYADGSEIPHVESNSEWGALEYDDKAYCWYDNSNENKDIYGGLYNWAAAMNGESSSNSSPSGVQGVCPNGWHLPSDEEWKVLEMNLGMSQATADEDWWRGTDEGQKMKEIGNIHWKYTGGTNKCGFTALPGGMRTYNSYFNNISTNANFWTSTERNTGLSWERIISAGSGSIGRYSNGMREGKSVRCIKDSDESTRAWLIGYWQNWESDGSPYIMLDKIDSRYNVINVSFAAPKENSTCELEFSPILINQETFKSQIAALQNQGKKVLISIGGQGALVTLNSEEEKNLFISSLENIIDIYGFDGIDIDLEGESLLVTEGSTIDNPVDPPIINLIAAIKQIMQDFEVKYTKKMILTMAPETINVHGAIKPNSYKDKSGSYLPIIDALRNELDALHVQLYNSGSMYSFEGKEIKNNTTDFMVAMTDALIHGFDTDGGEFKGLQENKIVVGLPAKAQAASMGYFSPDEVKLAMYYLRGKGPDSGIYQLSIPKGYPNIGGMMTWSINWDNANAEEEKYSNIFEYVFNTSSNLKPVANFSADGTELFLGDVVQFIDKSINVPKSWSWDFGDGETSIDQNPSHKYTATGTYTVTLTVTNDFGFDTETKTDLVHVFLNSSGGNDIKFNPNLEYGTVVDYEGNAYNTIIIGEQIWMAENLKVTRLNNGTPLSLITNNSTWTAISGPIYCYYKNDESAYRGNFGVLYSWNALETDQICPSGWRLPTENDWEILFEYIGNIGSGGKLKEMGTTHWNDPNLGATNECGFTALPGGARFSDDGDFDFNGKNGFWWSSTVSEPNIAISVSLGYDSQDLAFLNARFQNGFSVRCLKDVSPEIAPSAEFSSSETVITIGTKILFTDESTNSPTSWSWDFGDGETSIDQNPAHTYSAAGTYTVSLTVTNDFGSDTETKPDYIVVSTNGGETGVVSDIDGNTYQTIVIGEQEWMAQNLATTKYNDGTDIPNETDNSKWTALSTPAYCWYNNDEGTYKSTYGALYNWYVVDTDNLCPTGWHVPSDEEWKQLEIYLGMSQEDADDAGWDSRGTDEGGRLKEIGTTNWTSPNTGATNESGFTALPGGMHRTDGQFALISNYGYYWSGTNQSTSFAWLRFMTFDKSDIFRGASTKVNGASVRCLRD